MEISNFCLEIGWLWGISSALTLFFHADELSALIFGNENAAPAIQWMSFVPIVAGIRELLVHHQILHTDYIHQS
ncbi:hypothetical protein ACTHSJ_25430 [Paenibacillus cellulositrophicus]|uniref:hypothetical protein n=1 Tax=Paenibacillus TaxID=44249 RepID=UPI00268AD9AD